MTDYSEVLDQADSGSLPAAALVGASSHEVFRLTVDGAEVACKVFRPKHGDELEREWYGLNALQRAGLAPFPLAHSDGAIVMSWIDGAPITGPSQALRDALRRMYAIALQPPE